MYMRLIENLALLLSLSVVLQVVLAKARPTGLARSGLYGVVFGTLAVLTTMYPVQIPGGGAVSGSLVGIGIAGIFGGPWAAVIAALMGGTSRMLLGGAGTVGAVILTAFTAALSTAFYYLARRHPAALCLPGIWLFALVLHIAALLEAGIAGSLSLAVIGDIAVPFLVVLPLGMAAGSWFLLDYERRIVTEEKLRESESRFRGLFEGNRAPMLIVNPSNARIVDANAAAASFYGWSVPEMRSMPIGDVYTLSEEELHSNCKAVREGRQQRFDFRHRLVDGSVRDVEVYSGLFDGGGEQLMHSVIIDVTERLEAECRLELYRNHLEDVVAERTAEASATLVLLDGANEELRMVNQELEAANTDLLQTTAFLADANHRLEEASLAKGRFVASMSHELRTPLNSILGFSGILLQGLAGQLTDEQRTQIQMMNNSGKHLLELVNDILDLAKLEAGAASVDAEPFDAAAVVRDVVESLRPLAEEKKLILHADGIGSSVMMDSGSGKVRQILLNLVGNAIKFTDDGRIDVTLSCRADEAYRFAVSDTGLGIPAEALPRVFDPFMQVETPGLARPQGSGLGLNLSQEYAGLLGGSIEATSEFGHGSEFVLTLPSVHSEGVPTAESLPLALLGAE